MLYALLLPAGEQGRTQHIAPPVQEQSSPERWVANSSAYLRLTQSDEQWSGFNHEAKAIASHCATLSIVESRATQARQQRRLHVSASSAHPTQCLAGEPPSVLASGHLRLTPVDW